MFICLELAVSNGWQTIPCIMHTSIFVWVDSRLENTIVKAE